MDGELFDHSHWFEHIKRLVLGRQTLSRLSTTATLANCNQTVPSRFCNMPCKTFMRHNFLHRLDPVLFQGLSTRARNFTDGMFHEIQSSMRWLGHRTLMPRAWNHLSLAARPAILIPTGSMLSVSRAYISMPFSTSSTRTKQTCPTFAAYSKILVPRSIWK